MDSNADLLTIRTVTGAGNYSWGYFIRPRIKSLLQWMSLETGKYNIKEHLRGVSLRNRRCILISQVEIWVILMHILVIECKEGVNWKCFRHESSSRWRMAVPLTEWGILILQMRTRKVLEKVLMPFQIFFFFFWRNYPPHRYTTPLHLHQQLELLMQGRSDECFHAKLSVVKPSQHNVFNIDI